MNTGKMGLSKVIPEKSASKTPPSLPLHPSMFKLIFYINNTNPTEEDDIFLLFFSQLRQHTTYRIFISWVIKFSTSWRMEWRSRLTAVIKGTEKELLFIFIGFFTMHPRVKKGTKEAHKTRTGCIHRPQGFFFFPFFHFNVLPPASEAYLPIGTHVPCSMLNVLLRFIPYVLLMMYRSDFCSCRAFGCGSLLFSLVFINGFFLAGIDFSFRCFLSDLVLSLVCISSVHFYGVCLVYLFCYRGGSY